MPDAKRFAPPVVSPSASMASRTSGVSTLSSAMASTSVAVRVPKAVA